MYTAYINRSDKKVKVDINQYNTNFRRDNLNAYCSVCDSKLYVSSEASLKATHFSHYSKDLCPTKISSRELYLSLRFVHYNSIQKEIIIEKVKANLSKIYYECYKLCGALFYSEFKELLLIASKKRMWEYADIDIQHIPYCLLTLKLKFSSQKNKSRDSSVFFSLSNQYINEMLWIDFHNEDLTLLKYEAKTKELLMDIPVNLMYLESDLTNKENFKKNLTELLKAIY